MKRLSCVALLFAVVAAPFLVHADEGMWTFNLFPSDVVAKKYGFKPTQAWLDRVRLGSARLAEGCSGSFVSPDGLVMTNHHCAHNCIAQLSTAKKDLSKDGFFARTLADEPRCPTMEVDRLTDIRDVTKDVQGATQGLQGEAFEDAQRAVFAKLEAACATRDDLRCEVVTLYQGGRYDLYTYERMQDVRLVFAPETDIAAFGGDPDNFEFPRYDLDVSFMRVYRDGKPARTEPYFRWSKEGPKEGAVTFVPGNPGSTSRMDTLAQLAYQRDHSLPENLFWRSELRGRLQEFARRGPEFARMSEERLFGLENGLKSMKGGREALVEPAFWAHLSDNERALRAKVGQDAKLQQQYGDAWDATAKAMDTLKTFRRELRMLEQNAGMGSQLFDVAATLVRATEEAGKPNEQRLPEFTDANRPATEQFLFSPAPVYPELEELVLGFYLTRLREDLSPDHPAVKAVLGTDSPGVVAKRAVRGSQLKTVAVRKKLLAGGPAAIAASKDPMVVLARTLDGPARAVRKRYENEVVAVLKRNGERIGHARFALYGTSVAPDATFTPRLSYGSVQGYTADGKQVAPFTTVAGLYPRATGQEPFKLPPSWLRAKAKLPPETPLNFVTSNDIVGGNSGSPILDAQAEIVGLAFDGNIQSLGGNYGFDAAVNRTVAVDSRAIEAALRQVYGAERLLKELGLSTP
ncbi:S46 family peptidase [Corallococcus terminator]|uniref:Dipeptidyl-peptidase n=1 Tax=Corallococcus terminator TaxID=2316733 RepID=A0A3A8HUC6_9BACT|nr:S46 family peptidase [Corallococcus terminator]RKG74809.1 S46 family peptidase [Corallococcus terminator]